MRKIKHRYQGILLGAVMLLATGCSGSKTAYTSAANENQSMAETVAKETQQIVIETEPMQETAAGIRESESEASSPEPVADTAVIPNQLIVDIQYLYKSKWEGEQQLFNGKAAQIYVLGDEYPALQNAMLRKNQMNQEDLTRLYDEQVDYAKEMLENNGDFPGFEFERTASVARADERILSIVLNEYSWLGGAHPNTFLVGYNYAPLTGEELNLKDVASDYDAIYAHVLEELENRETDLAYFDDYKETVQNVFYGDSQQYGELQWTMDMSGVTIYFNPYDIAPYAAGRFVIELPFSEYGQWFKQEYVYTGPAYGKALMTNQSYEVDLDDDGHEDKLLLMDSTSEESYGSRLLIDVGEMSVELPLMGYYKQSYLLHTDDGRSYLYVESTGDNDWSFLEIFELQPKHVEPKGQYQGGSLYGHAILNPEDFVLFTKLDALGTYIGYRGYRLGEDGMPVTEETVYELLHYQTGSDYVITSITELPVEIHKKDSGGTSMEQEMMPAGTRFHLRRTDGKSYVEAQLDDGRTCTVRYETVDYQKQINGINEFDCFKDLFYAG